MLRKLLFISLSLAILSVYAATDTSPYAGQQQRAIKALSANEMSGLLEGKGMGLAKAGELNHYPGPKHVLELADKLALSKEQTEQTINLFDDMKNKAIPLGKQIIEKEHQLDQLFSTKSINKENLKQVLLEIGSLRAQLRYVHLHAHLQQKEVLTAKQLIHYDKLRGYTDNKGHDHHGEHQHGHH